MEVLESIEIGTAVYLRSPSCHKEAVAEVVDLEERGNPPRPWVRLLLHTGYWDWDAYPPAAVLPSGAAVDVPAYRVEAVRE